MLNQLTTINFLMICVTFIMFPDNALCQCVNVALNKQVSATGSWGAYTPDKAFDGNCGTHWNAGSWPIESIKVDLQQTYSIGKIILKPQVLPNGNETYKIYTSTDMVTWNVVDNFTLFITNGMYITRSYDSLPLTNVRGVKIECTSGPSWTSFSEIGIYETQISGGATITASGSLRICQGDSVLLTASAGAKYLWNTGKTTKSIYAEQTGTYWAVVSSSPSGDCLLKGTGSVCADTAFINVTVDSKIIANAGLDTTICKGSNTALSASGGTSYLWTPTDGLSYSTIPSPIASPTITTTYTVTVSDNGTCPPGIDNVKITVKPLPIAQINGKTTICAGDSTTLIAKGGISYLWSTGQTVAAITIKPYADTSYSVIVSDSSCSNTAAATLSVNILPIADAGSDVIVCPNNSIQLNASGGTGYQWIPSQNLSNDTISNPIATSLFTTSYIVKITDSNACVSYDTVHVIVDTSLVAQFITQYTIDSLAEYASLTVDFVNTTIGGLSYDWAFGDASFSTLTSPSHIYTSAGDYSVRLIAYNMNGCSDTAYSNIQVKEKAPVLWIPNSFTPDENGLNDVFRVYSTGILELKCMIFNRWGELLYQWETLNGGWDGTYKNKNVPAGIYVYVLKAKGTNSVIYQRAGHITLLR